MTGRSAVLAAMVMAIAAIGASAASGTVPRFVWNLSGSVPIGLYRVRPARDLTVTTLVVAYPPEPLATWLADGRYLPRGVPLIKPILALDGQTVCRAGPLITVDGRESGVAHENDHSGRPLPFWQGCRVIGHSEIFLMNPHEPASLDGRYFGPLPIASIAGLAEPLWTLSAGPLGLDAAPTPLYPRFDHARAGGLPPMSPVLKVNTMDLTTLITACALTVDPKIMHALIWHQSGGEPWAFSVSGQHHQVLRSMEDALRAARDTRPDTVVIRVGLTGLPGTPRSVTATMFTPCSNIASAARRIAQLVELCRTSTRSQADPNRCAIAAYHGSWERPDNGFADIVLGTAAKGDAPDFEMPEGTGNDTGEVNPTSRNTPPATAPSATPDNDEPARQSPLFPVIAKPSDSSPDERSASDRTAAGEQKIDAQTVPPTAAPPHVGSVFVPRSALQSAPKLQ